MASQQPKKKMKTLHSFFPTKESTPTTEHHQSSSVDNQVNQPSSSHVENLQSSTLNEIDSSLLDLSAELVRDPGIRKKICDWPLEKRDEIRRKYLMHGPYQPKLANFEVNRESRRFQYHWFEEFSWLEYSPTTHMCYCFPCYLFGDHTSSSSLVNGGFNNWKRVHQGSECVFLKHVGKQSSPHYKCVADVEALMKPSGHIDKIMQRVSREDVKKNRLRLKATITVIQRLALQGCAFRGHDESEFSMNRGNVIEWVDFLASWVTEVNDVVLNNAPGNAKYISPDIQKEILAILANKVCSMIRKEVGDACFSILVDEAQDESGREQMAIILRFVNLAGILTERFFAIKAVSETSSETLYKEICNVLSTYNLQVDKLRGQGYDGASNMSGQFNGLKALFLNDCEYAYFVHCFAHRLQLTLLAAAKKCDPIWKFFSYLDNIINIVKSSPKRNTQLQVSHRREIEEMLESGDLVSGQGVNQMTTLKRTGSTRWSSHFSSVGSMIRMFSSTSKVLKDLSENGPTAKARVEASGARNQLMTFEFAFSLHLMMEVLGITNFLSQAFQQESIDILTALQHLSTSRTLLQELRDKEYEKLLQTVKEFCSKQEIQVPDMSSTTGRGAKQITLEHLYHVEHFNQSIDFQLTELSSRFNEKSVRLLQLSVALDPKDCFHSFNADDVYKLAVDFYPKDFEENDRHVLKGELPYYIGFVLRNREFQVPTLAKLMEKLVETKKDKQFRMISRLIRLVLTLSVSTATTERAFSAMKHVKTDIRNKMADEFMADALTLYIEREFVSQIDIDSIIDDFASQKTVVFVLLLSLVA